MTLVHLDSLKDWKGEAIGGVRHPLDIEQKWTDAELKAVGLGRLVSESIPDGKLPDGEPFRERQGDQVVLRRPFRDETPEEISARQESEVLSRISSIDPGVRALGLTAMNEFRKLKNEPPATEEDLINLFKGAV